MAEIKNNIHVTVQMENEITVDGMSVKGQRAVINSIDPNEITIDNWMNNPNLYKEHRKEIRALEAEFEDSVYNKQDEMILKKG